VILGIHHNYHYFAHYMAMRRAIADGAIGRPFLVRFEGVGGGGHWPGVAGYDPDWRVRAARGGGALIDNGYHSMYMCEYLMDSPVTHVSAHIGTYGAGEVDDLAIVTLSHAAGVSTVQVSWSIAADGRSVTEVHGTEGSLQVADDNSVRLWRNQAGTWETYWTPAGRLSFRFTFAGSYREFADALEAGREPPATLRHALHNLAIVMAGYESSRQGRAVPVAELEALAG